MDLSFLPIDESHDALLIEFASPEEFQTYARCLPPDMPEGTYLAVRKGVNARKQITLTVGVAKVGQPLTLPGDDATPKPPPPVQAALAIPPVVREAKDPQLEVMAARNGVTVDDAWRKMNRARREASVAKALQQQNAR